MISIPDKVKVGFQKRGDALTNMLGFVVEQDKKGWKQSVAWERWRNHEIEPLIMDNVPKSGYVINQSLRHMPFSSFGNPRTKVRVHCPDGFEIEISTENLVEILEVSNISKKYIDSECVLGWFAREIWLIPVDTDIYRTHIKNKQEQAEKEMLKNMKKTKTEKKVKSEDDIALIAQRKLNKENLQIGDFVSLKEGILIPSHNHFVYIGKRKIVTDNFIKKLSINSIDKKKLVEDIPEVPVFVNVSKMTLKQIINAEFKIERFFNYYNDNEYLVFDDKKIAYESLNKRFSNAQKEDFKVKVESCFESNQDKSFSLSKDANGNYSSLFQYKLVNIFKKIKTILTNENVEKEKASFPILVKSTEENVKFDLKLFEIEPVSLGRIKNTYGVALSFEVIIRLLNPNNLEVIEEHVLNISERVAQGGYNEFAKLIASKIKNEKLYEISHNLEYPVYSTRSLNKKLVPAEFKVIWTKV